MLNGAGGLNADGLALDLQFAADKTLTARKGPTPVFTRASTATFVGSNGLIQSAAIDIPRFDHTSAGVCRGLLIEESRTNLFQYSEIFNEAASSNYWDSATANAVTSNQTTSPDGAATADLLTTSTTSFDCFVRRAINWVGSTQYSYSIFLKRGPSNHRYVGLYIGAGITGLVQYPYFDFDNPTTVQIPSGTMVGTINSTRVDAYPNGWYRVSVTFTTAATPVTIFGGVYVSTSNGTLPSIPTAGLDCYIWGIQAETGAFATSYIPTTTAPLTRSADVCSITGQPFLKMWNASEGSMLATAQLATAAATENPFLLDFYSAVPHEWGLRLFSNNFQVIQRDGSVKDITITSLSSQPFTYAAARNSSNSAGSVYGLVASGTAPSLNNFTGVEIGRRAGGSLYFNGHLAAIRYYRKRLPNAQLVTLTT